ncbi:MAG: L-threonylcarbamoyladenylate synthase [Deltaproteobacteria bacterium]|nr:L-threonylcarbamoyladenylate synthase [Deltaproteobacteria bacterium]
MEITKIIKKLVNGTVFAVPTETVFGLVADIQNEKAIQKIYDLKGRDFSKPLSIFISDLGMLEKYVRLPLALGSPLLAEFTQSSNEGPKGGDDVLAMTNIQNLVKKYWPGPLTLVFKASKKVPSSILAGGDTVGIRCSSRPLIQQIVQKLGRPVTATSANLSGKPSAKTAEQVKEYFGNTIDVVVDNFFECSTIESTILDVTISPWRVLRPGAVVVEESKTISRASL